MIVQTKKITGYGFLSENAAFCRSVQKAGAAFLGPPDYAITKLGDKLESKDIALKAGVNVVPGYDGTVESLEQALELCNDMIGYPVLLKALAGGGGKGMRVCYNDKDIKEAWVIAKSEAIKFFSDDRLLLEKFIEKPHHIEFQVMSAPSKDGNSTDVAVFPERECSIQRRNQKIIEETPSCLLTQSTREAMAAQVRKLCQVVGYQSAGTVEFLVDEEQNFFFLEMNTRLQVEHPVTEAISGIDLVKAMLWVGAGWGLPEELQPYTEGIVPHKGHAIEARIYAEDPLRGFLPSTGPLVKYKEPTIGDPKSESYVRVDSGVRMGHVVSPHYDPMLSKVVAYAPDRGAAIQGLNNALDEYVIEGVQHNARLVQEVLRHPKFQEGATPTSFLPTHYPDGFVGVQLQPNEEEEYAVAAAMIDALKRDWLDKPPLAGNNTEDIVMVRMGGMFGNATYRVNLDLEDGSATVVLVDKEGKPSAAERTIDLDPMIDYDPTTFLAKVKLDGMTCRVQVVDEAVTGEYKLQLHGANREVLIQSEREFELSQYMHDPPEVDTSNSVLSPMPGALISFAVAVGDEVQIGQELCIVEAMKMQNIIRAPRDGTIASLEVAVGSSLNTDQCIITLENEGGEEEEK